MTDDKRLLPMSALVQSAQSLIIICTSGTGGDIHPFITIAQALQARGRRVLVVLPRFHEALAVAAAVPYKTLGTVEEFQAALANPLLWDERKGWQVIWNAAVVHLNALHDLVAGLPSDEPCVVLSHPLLLPAAALARAARPQLRIVSTSLAPSNVCSSYDIACIGSLRLAPWVPRWARQALWKLVHTIWINPVALPALNAARKAHGLPAVSHFFRHMLSAPDTTVGLFPAWFAASQPDWPTPFVSGDFVGKLTQVAAPLTSASPVALSANVEQFLAAGDAPVVVTPGTGHQHAAQYLHSALQAVAALGRRCIVVTPHAAQLPAHLLAHLPGSLPASVLWQRFVPFDTLLPRVAAVVHHGGIGTTAEALRAGTPQLVVPFAYDQFDNGLRAHRLGVAEVLAAQQLTAQRMQPLLARLLTAPEVQVACQAFAQRMRQDALTTTLIDQIESALIPAAF